jgi:hypothetical protein
MRIYEGSPRQDFEEVFRSIGAFIDQRGMREVLLAEAPDGFIVQGLVPSDAAQGTYSDSFGSIVKETLTFLDDDISRFMEEAIARRGKGDQPPETPAGYYETAFRVLGRYMDEQKPRDVFFFEQDGAFVLRLLPLGAATRHTLAEFTREDIADMIAQAPRLRYPAAQTGARTAAGT